MAPPLAQALGHLQEAVDRLTAQHTELLRQLEDLKARNEDLEQELRQTQQDLHNARIDVEFLTMSHRLADTPDALVATRRHIARLIRTVDSCIAMLRDE